MVPIFPPLDASIIFFGSFNANNTELIENSSHNTAAAISITASCSDKILEYVTLSYLIASLCF